MTLETLKTFKTRIIWKVFKKLESIPSISATIQSTIDIITIKKSNLFQDI